MIYPHNPRGRTALGSFSIRIPVKRVVLMSDLGCLYAARLISQLLVRRTKDLRAHPCDLSLDGYLPYRKPSYPDVFRLEGNLRILHQTKWYKTLIWWSLHDRPSRLHSGPNSPGDFVTTCVLQHTSYEMSQSSGYGCGALPISDNNI